MKIPRRKILLVFGTRPEAIKMAPILMELNRAPEDFEARVAVTAQHRQMLDQALADFRITPQYDLDIMRENQDLFHVTGQALVGLRAVLNDFAPDCVLVQGDTTTTFVGALASFYMRTTVAHIEAGLRTFEKYSPYPEEINRRLTGCIADIHFAPTANSQQNLLREGISIQDIVVTGNTGIDALLWTLANHPSNFENNLPEAACRAAAGRFILVTAHRRESFGAPLHQILAAIAEVSSLFPDCHVIFPVHPNPNVKQTVCARLAGIPNVHLVDPLDYVSFCHLMSKAEIVLTDSGGVQEEAPSVSTPVLVMRETTERPEGVEAGVAKLVGADRERIVSEVTRLMTDSTYRNRMTGQSNPYGDGSAALRIVDTLRQRVKISVAGS